jgi:CRISPR-associated protein Csy2
MGTFLELMSIKDKSEKNKAIKKAFSPATLPVDISGHLTLAIISLINLTDKLGVIEDVLSEKRARIKLLDNEFVNRCINTYQYRHSHNVKFPDYRVRGSLRLSPEITQFPKENFKNSCSYAQTGADINISNFLCAEFIYKEQLTCIGTALVDGNSEIKSILKELGVAESNLNSLELVLREASTEQTIDDLTENYFSQLRFPFFNEQYVSISPVVSNDLQTKVHQFCTENYHSSITFNLERSANVGTLAASVGGRIKLLKSIPKGLKYHHTYYDNAWNKQELLDVLVNYEELKRALTTSNTKKILRSKYFNRLLQNLRVWNEKNSQTLYGLDPIALSHRLNLELSNHIKLSQFSYQPEYTRLFVNALNHIKNDSDNSRYVSKKPESSDTFIVIPNIKVNDANAMNSNCTVGIPSLMGLWGFIHKFERNINQLNHSIVKINGFAVCIHDYTLPKRASSKEVYQRKNKQIVTPGLIDSIQCDLSVSLVLRVISQKELSSNVLLNSLPTHLCGGSVHLGLKDLAHITHIKDFDCVDKTITNKQGKWLVPCIKEHDTVAELLNTSQAYNLAIVNTGYLFLEKPKHKEGILDDLQHAFSECILSSAELIKYTHSKDYHKLFWSYNFTEQSVFLAN